MSSLYPRIPDPPDRDPQEPIAHYGLRLFRWVLAEGVTVTLNNDQLGAADMAGIRAAAGAYDDLTGDVVRDRITRTRHLIADAIRRRIRMDADGPIPAPSPQGSPDGGRPGSGVRRVPIIPRVPPAGGLAAIPEDDRQYDRLGGF